MCHANMVLDEEVVTSVSFASVSRAYCERVHSFLYLLVPNYWYQLWREHESSFVPRRLTISVAPEQTTQNTTLVYTLSGPSYGRRIPTNTHTPTHAHSKSPHPPPTLNPKPNPKTQFPTPNPSPARGPARVLRRGAARDGVRAGCRVPQRDRRSARGAQGDIARSAAI